MRLFIKLSSENSKLQGETRNVLPVDYRMLIVSLIKESLKKSSQEYYDKLYHYKGKANKQSKDFTFAVYMPNAKLEDEKFFAEGDIQLRVSSPDAEFMMMLYNGLLKLKSHKYKSEYSILIKGVSLEKEKEVSKEGIVVKTL